MSNFRFSCVLLAIVLFVSHASGQNTPGATPSASATNAKTKSASPSSRGNQVFQQNCSRCHNAPQGFPQRVSGSIARHMRVRASLSAEDERALLKFLNP